MGDPGFLRDHGGGVFGPPRWLLPLLVAASLVLAGLGALGVISTPKLEMCEAIGGHWERTSGRYWGARCVMPDEAGSYD